MKHVIGKRNGKTIGSGGGSLEEQKNNLKHWEVLDEESSPIIRIISYLNFQKCVLDLQY